MLAAVLLYGIAAAAWVFSPVFPMHLLRDLQTSTDGWINATLVLAGVLSLGQLWLVFGPGRQRPSDVGWVPAALLPALGLTLVAWLAMNASTAMTAGFTGTPLEWNAGWARGGALPGALIAQLSGNALIEETLFRAWLWPQLALRFARRMRQGPAWVLALVASQSLFALMHIPVRLAAGAEVAALGGLLLTVFVVGVVFALLYAATRNLFFVIGVHALGNAPSLLFDAQGPAPTLVLLGVATLIALGWWRFRAASARPDGAHGPGAIPPARTAPAPPRA